MWTLVIQTHTVQGSTVKSFMRLLANILTHTVVELILILDKTSYHEHLFTPSRSISQPECVLWLAPGLKDLSRRNNLGFWAYVFYLSESVSCSVVSDSATPWTVALQAPLSLGLSRQEYWRGCHSLLQEIFLTQGSNPSLLRCRQILHSLSPWRSFYILTYL